MSLYVDADYTVDDADYFIFDSGDPLYWACDYVVYDGVLIYVSGDDTCPTTTTDTPTGTSAGGYNMYRLPVRKRKLRKIKYLGPANEKLTFYVESTPENRWIPTTIYKPSVLEEIERNGLIVRQINAAKLRRIIMADDEWLMLN